jgi:cytochrome c oxidase cbb3-type subunit III
MSNSWSWYVIAMTVLVVVGSALLLWRTSGKRPGDAAQETGHVWDGDLREYDKPLPRWWINLFYLTIVFLVLYLVVYPGLGNFAGTQQWSSRRQHDVDRAATDAKLAATFRAYDGQPIEQLAANPSALALGRSLFASHCAACHGSLGQGAPGYPNLTDDIWQWGGTSAEVLQTVLHGRTAAMPPWGQVLEQMGGRHAVDAVAIYVQTLSDPQDRAANAPVAANAARLYMAVCAACHGPQGKGNPQIGAPDLTDSNWLYDGRRATIRAGIRQGRAGVMPAHLPLLGETRARLAAAYAWSLSHPAGAAP